MIKRIVASAVLAALMTAAAQAQQAAPAETVAPQAQPAQETQQPAAQNQTPTAVSAPQTADECMQLATELAVTAEEKKLDEAKLDRIEDLLTKMETHCDAKQFQEAMAVAKDIKSTIETQ